MAEVVEKKESPVSGEEEKRMPEALVGVDDVRALKTIVSAIRDMVDEATIKLSPKEGLVLSALEPAKSAMVQLVIPRENCFVYDVKETGFYTINFKELEKALRRVKEESRIELRFAENGLVVKSMGQYRKSFKLPLLAGEPFEVKSPVVDLKAGITFIAPQKEKGGREPIKLAEMISDMELMGTDVEVTIDSGKASFRTQSERGEAEITIEKMSPTVMDIWTTDGEQKAVYSLNYLHKISKPAKMADELRIEMATDKPMKLTYKFPLVGTLVYWLAHITVK
jgi:proliferating cell nuclear antigen